MKWIGYIWIGILLVITAISLPQCINLGGEASLFNATGQQSTLDPQGPVALNQLNIFYITLWVTLFLFVTVGGALAFAMWKFRHRKGDDPDFVPPQSHGHPLVEMGLVVGSAALLVVIAIPTLLPPHGGRTLILRQCYGRRKIHHCSTWPQAERLAPSNCSLLIGVLLPCRCDGRHAPF